MVMRYRLLTLLIVIAVVAVLVSTGLIRRRRHGLFRAIREVNSVATEIDKHSQEVRDLASP
jgi:hypothetical protein